MKREPDKVVLRKIAMCVVKTCPVDREEMTETEKAVTDYLFLAGLIERIREEHPGGKDDIFLRVTF